MTVDPPSAEPSVAHDENAEMPVPQEDCVDFVSPVVSDPGGMVPREVMELKTAIERRLRDRIIQRKAGPGSVEELSGLGIIQGVGIGMGTPSSGGHPGTPALTIFVSEPISADRVRSLIAEATGIQVPLAIGLNIERTGLIEPQA